MSVHSQAIGKSRNELETYTGSNALMTRPIGQRKWQDV